MYRGTVYDGARARRLAIRPGCANGGTAAGRP